MEGVRVWLQISCRRADGCLQVVAGPCNHRRDADTRAAGNVGPIPSFPGNSRSGSQLVPKPLSSGVADENSWISETATGRKSRAHFSPGGAGVESTGPNFLQPLRKRVADCEHGFESRKAVAGGASTPSTVSSHR